ncbi:hypothetical protein MESMUL_17090 [Mesosutterella multiformis]|uniref:Uncharacterized protein n=1 Tax=Mesosutterella multiformis TaxID=2259133 RepID=A0A388SDW9_9BURK|nr:hypothetical protein [Mesosutterella multiformis]GBO94355.1 hypothetical protein MESMUL_17090 [Mesosutterella multiformis]
MKYDLQQTTKLVTQLQQAHRLAAAFYMRILPLFDTIAYQTLYSEFWFWEPTETYTPPAIHIPIRHFGMVLSAAVCFDSCLPGQDIQQGSKRR